MRIGKPKSILKKISIVVISSLIFTALTAIAAFYYLFFYMKDQIQDSYLKYLEMYAQIVESKLEETSQNGFGIIIDSKIQDRLSEWILLSGQKTVTDADSMNLLYRQLLIKKDIEQILFNNMALVGQIRHLSIITPDGSILSSSGESGFQDNENIEQVIKTADDGNGAACWISDPSTSYIIHARSIRSLKAKMTDSPLGTFVMWVDMAKIMRTANARMPVDDSILIMKDRNGGVIFVSDPRFDGALMSSLKNDGRIDVEGESYLVCSYRSGELFEYYMLVSAEKIYRPVEQFVLALIGVFLLIIFIVVLGTDKISKEIMKPIPKLAQAMKTVETGCFRITDRELLEDNREDEIGDLCRDFVYMTQKIDQLVQENYVKQLVIKETELRALQAQINPHFLYNVLESVNCMAVIAHQPDISVMVKSLGSLLREAMSNQEIFHTIKQELGLIEAYLAIQSIRFENKLSYELMVEESVMNWEVPKFFLQPIVENAVVYGIEATGKGCQIRIQIKSENSRLYAEISDSGPGMDENVIQAIYNGTIKGRGNGIGLHNIIKRLDIMCRGRNRFEIISSPGEGTRVIIELAVQEGEGRDVYGNDCG